MTYEFTLSITHELEAPCLHDAQQLAQDVARELEAKLHGSEVQVLEVQEKSP